MTHRGNSALMIFGCAAVFSLLFNDVAHSQTPASQYATVLTAPRSLKSDCKEVDSASQAVTTCALTQQAAGLVIELGPHAGPVRSSPGMAMLPVALLPAGTKVGDIIALTKP